MVEKSDTVSMKRFLSTCILMCCAAFAFAYDRPVFDWNLSASAVSYGSPSVKTAIKEVTSDSYIHLVLSGSAGLAGRLDEYLFATFSFTPVADFCSSDKGSVVILDYCGNMGLRVYPNVGGLNVGVEYSLGTRQDIINITGSDKTNSFTPFGNGFRFVTEYDFTVHTKGFAPVVGMSWRHMPRGSNVSDNIFSLYVSFIVPKKD